MKFLKNLLALLLALTCAFAIVACDNNENEELDTTKHGWAFEYDVEEEEDKTYVVITGLFLSDGDKYALSEDDYQTIDLEIGKDQKITVPVYEEDDATKVVYNDDDTLKTTEIVLGEEYHAFKIADAAFANQLIIGSVTVDACVEEIGSTAFAGCTNIEEMTLPYVGATAGDNVNAKKLFAYIFGTAEAADCTSISCSYNGTGVATYFVPNSLKKVTVNYAEGSTLPGYAFNGLSTVEEIVVTGVTAIGNSAFANCAGAYTVTIPSAVTEIGKDAFYNCSKLINFTMPESIQTIFQNAFYGCARLGYGKNTTLTVNASYVGEKAFYGCTSISAVYMPNAEFIGECAFYNCSSLKAVNYKSGATVGNDAFANCHEDLSFAG